METGEHHCLQRELVQKTDQSDCVFILQLFSPVPIPRFCVARVDPFLGNLREIETWTRRLGGWLVMKPFPWVIQKDDFFFDFFLIFFISWTPNNLVTLMTIATIPAGQI